MIVSRVAEPVALGVFGLLSGVGSDRLGILEVFFVVSSVCCEL